MYGMPPAVLLVDEHEVEEVLHRELVVDRAERRRELRRRGQPLSSAVYMAIGVCLGTCSNPERNMRIGMLSPRTGAPSIISNLATVSESLYTFAP